MSWFVFFKNCFKDSKFFILIFNFMGCVEKLYLNSGFRKLYPNEYCFKFFKKSEIINSFLFHPLCFIFVFGIFLSLSTIGVSSDLQFTSCLAFVSFFIGSFILPRFFLNRGADKFVWINADDFYSLGFCCILVGILFFFVCAVSMGGLPIFNPSLRYELIPIFTMPVTLLIPGVGLVGSSYLKDFKNNKLTSSQVRFRFVLLSFIASSFLLTLGYRTHVGAVILMMIIMGYYGRIFALWEVIIGLVFTVFSLIGFGYLRSLEEQTMGNVDLFSSLRYRVDFTLNVLDLLTSISGDYGITHGRLTLSAIPGSSGFSTRMIIGNLIAWRGTVSITPTIIGPMLVDFGKIGIMLGMGLIGFILGLGHKIMKITNDSSYIFIYALLLSYAIICIETGLMEINVLGYFLLGFMLCLANIIKNRKKFRD